MPKFGSAAICAVWVGGIAFQAFQAPAAAKKPETVFGAVGTVNQTPAMVVKGFGLVRPSGATITVHVAPKKVKYYPQSPDASSAGFLTGDAVEAVGPTHAPLTAGIVYYDVAPFPLIGVKSANKTANGMYLSGGGSGDTTLSLTTQGGATLTFTLDAITIYVENGQATTAPTFDSDSRLTVKAEELTNATWLAEVVVIKHRR